MDPSPLQDSAGGGAPVLRLSGASASVMIVGRAPMTKHIIRIFFIVTVAIITVAYLRGLT